jgi:hypothetical protein
MSDDNDTDFVEIYTLILINFLNFCQSINIEDIKLKGEKKMSVIFILYQNYSIFMLVKLKRIY